MTSRRSAYRYVRALALAIGSIAGAGLLSTPSAVLAAAGDAAVLAWLVALAMCVPMLLMFGASVRRDPGGIGLESLVRRGLGDVAGGMIPVMFVGVVGIGLPTGAMVAGRFVALATGWPAAEPIAALAVLGTALATNLAGLRTGDAVGLLGSWSLLIVCGWLIVTALAGGSQRADLLPGADWWQLLPAGVTLACWAFIGFENLTFLSDELPDPHRDFVPIAATALAVLGVVAIGLTVAIAANVAPERLDPVGGLLQLAAGLGPAATAAGVGVAVVAMLINAVAWLRGVSTMIIGAAERAMLPRGLARRRRALGLMGILFALTTAVLLARPELIVAGLAASSATFIAMYVMCVLAWLIRGGPRGLGIANLAVLVVMGAAVIGNGPSSLPALGIGLVALAMSVLFARRRASRAAGAPVSKR
ncbi:hypothetical protein [Naumannella huperziae]